MITFHARNTNTMMKQVYDDLLMNGINEDSRNGPVRAFREPATFVYSHPEEMVNVCPIRDANPFFHIMEAVAMVAGHNSVEFLSHFNSNMSQYSDDGETYNAFYGTRMGEQLNQVITLLHKDPITRQAVIQLWSKKDLLKKTKDKACNMSMVFRRFNDVLDMTVYCRSNDLIYGGVTGANIVHFPFIHAVICHELGCVQGEFTHVVNNAHVYYDNPHFENMSKMKPVDVSGMYLVEVDCDVVAINYFCEVAKRLPAAIMPMPGGGEYINGVLIPMYNTFARHKGNRNGLVGINAIKDDAWKLAAKQWLTKRETH